MKNRRSILKMVLTLTLFMASVGEIFSQWGPTKGLYSGDVHSIIVSNGEIIAGTKYIYKSGDGGITWENSSNGINVNVTYIRGLIKSGTNLVAVTDYGVYYSSDNGDNWTQCTGTSALNVNCIIKKGTNLFLSTMNDGVYKSVNNGITWTSSSNGITTPYLEMRSLAVIGNDIYAASDGYGIFKSTNDGASWTTVNTGLPGSFYSVSSLVVTGNTIIAGTYGAGTYKSVNGGSSWTGINNGIPSNCNVMGMGLNGTTVFAGDMTGVLYKTTDYTNWAVVSFGNYTATRFEAYYQDNTDFYIGTWGFGSPEKSYGLFKTSDNGTTWEHIGITEYPVSVLELSGSNILAGTNDISGNSGRISLYKTSETDTIWNYNLGGVDTRNVTALKASGSVVYMFDNQGPGNSLVYRSTNNGNSWSSTGYNVLYNYFEKFVIAGSLIYASDNSAYYSSDHVLVSSDNGQSWTVVNTGLGSPVHYTYSLVLKGTTLFLGTDNGVYKNTVSQNNWISASNGLTNMYIKSLHVVGNDLYAGTQGGGIFKSSDDGASWTSVSTGIPLFTNITCFASSGSNLFAGTDNGVFVTSNGGAGWTNANSGLLDTTVTVLLASSNYLWAGTASHGVWKRALSEFTSGVPSMPGPIAGNINVCEGSTNTYTVAPVSGATSYTWGLPAGWSGSTTTNSITATAGSGGNISVTANNSFGSSAAQTTTVSVTSVNVTVAVSGMTLTAQAGATSYIWIDCANNLPTGATGQVYTASTAGNYAVIINSSGCTDTSDCYQADTICNIIITGADLPFNGLTVLLAVDTATSVTPGAPGSSCSWDYSALQNHYEKTADYHFTSQTPYATEFNASNIYTFGPGSLYGSLYGGAPVGSSENGYVFWKSDNTGFWVTGFRPDQGICEGINVHDNPQELLIGAPASYGSSFNNTARWELSMNANPANVDTFYVRRISKTITADACGSLITPYDSYNEVLREHEYVITIDSVYIKSSGITISATEFSRDTANNYLYLAPSVGYPACIVHCDKSNTVKDVEYYNGDHSGITEDLTQKFLKIFPNPSEGSFEISLMDTDDFSVQSSLTVFNSSGRVIHQSCFYGPNCKTDLTEEQKGLYLIQIVRGKNIYSEKIIIR